MAETRKARTPPKKVEAASVSVAEISASKYRRSDADSYVKRFVGTSAFCASYNARNLAACVFKLYRNARGPAKGRRASKAEHEWLRRGLDGPGAKAAAMVSDSVEVVEDHPVLDLLRDPNRRDTGFEFWECHHACKEVAGNAYAYVFDDGTPRLETLLPQHTRIMIGTGGTITGYVYGRTRDVEISLPPEAVLHERFAKSFFDPFYGAGPMQQATVPHDIRTAMNEYSLAVFDKMARPDYALIFKKALSEQQVKQAREEVRKRFQGQSNIGEVLILSGGEADIKPLSWTPKELDYDAGRKTLDTEICTAFGVPETFLRPNEGALSQAREMRRWYGLHTLLPRAVKHAEWLMERILPLFDGTEGYWFAVENPVPEDEALKATRVQVLVNSGVMTINEARADMGLGSSPDAGADLLRVNGVPLDKVGAVPTFGLPPRDDGGDDDGSGNGSPVDGPGDPGDGGSTPDGDAAKGGDGVPDGGRRSDAAAGAGADRHAGPCCAPADAAANPVVVSQKALYAAARKENVSPLVPAPIDPMEEVCRKFFAEQMRATLAEMDAKPSGHQKNGRMTLAGKATEAALAEAQRLLGVWGITDEKWTAYLAERLKPLSEDRMLDAAIRGIRHVAAMVEVAESADPSTFTLTNPRAATWAKRNTAEILAACNGINATTADTLAATLAQGIEAGESIEGLKRRVKDAYTAENPDGDSMSDYRSWMIARTESARAHGNGTLAGWDATEVVAGKRWLASADACEFCEAAAKQYGEANVALGESFYPLGSTITGTDGGTMTVDFEAVQGPPLHPHDKCTMVPVLRSGT